MISLIGDPYFSVCDEHMDEIYRHPNHPDIVRIIDCEGDTTIDIYCENDTMEAAKALCKLLNMD